MGQIGTRLGATLVALVLACAAAEAQELAPLDGEFDARRLGDPEKRLLQVGLAAAGAYDGLIDGRWGRASQAAIEHYAAEGGLPDPDGLVRNYHAALLAAEAQDFVAAHDLAYRGGAPYGHLLLAPPGAFEPDPSTSLDDLVLDSAGLEIRTFASEPEEASRLHRGLEDRLGADSLAYLVRDAARWVTAATVGRQLFYARTDYSAPADSFFTTVVAEDGSGDRALYRVVVGAIDTASAASLDAPGGRLDRLIAAGRALVAAAPSPEAADRGLPPPPAADGSGTGFFVTDSALVTAAHVVEGCAGIALADGTPLALAARHPRLDLALLASPRRSQNSIPLASGAARLGQRIFVLGYPFFGTYGTALNITGGNVSALTGIGDDADTLTISAPVQPGNSGGPLMGRDGTVIGVVVARLDGLKVVEDTGALPENINYAVSGRALRDFLADEGVSLPRAAPATADFDDGVPEAIQAAVVPVICRGA